MNTEFTATRFMKRLTAADAPAFILHQHARCACGSREESAALAGSVVGEDMRSSRSVIGIAIVLSMSGIGADNCGPYWSTAATPPPTDPHARPWCQFDPPVGCNGICADVDTLGFTPACADISAGPLTAQFKSAATIAFLQATMAGKQPCPPDGLDSILTPCQLGIEPQPNPPESQEFCMNPPPGCVF